MGRGVTIHMEVYLPFRGQRRWEGAEEVPDGTRARDLPGLLGLCEPELAVLVNGRYARQDLVLAEGDRVAVLRPSEGG